MEGGRGGAGGQLGPLCHSGAVLSADDRDVHTHKPMDRLRRPLAAVWHPINSD